MFEFCVAIWKRDVFLKENNDDFSVNSQVHILKITMPLRADIIVVNQPNSDIIL